MSISVSDLTNAERAVALYASDMPNDCRSQRGDRDRLEFWIVQGATRMGLEFLYRTAALHSGYRLCWLNKSLSAEQKRAEAERFPNKARIDLAGQMAANSILHFRPNAEALARKQVAFDGGCPKCEGTGEVWGLWVIDVEAEWYEEGYRSCWVCRDDEPPTTVEFMAVAA
ncbi:hypothetical protein GCM10012287_46900 [Streptomyces daqingensis]|uniref:Uncharacterized protein n=2 Tax=Streptomyces daqingensis TaxID=1472640 RepID=A0ABQ2MNE4_9ACTN|nr:hypothetical protein GCM10012287_46900 [Streptomyces daqingensis]